MWRKSRKQCMNKMEISIERQRNKRKFWSCKAQWLIWKWLEGFKHRSEQAKQKISKLEQNKGLKRSEKTVSGWWNTMKWTNIHILEAPKGTTWPSWDEWLTKIWCVHTHTHTHYGILLSHKKNEIIPFAITWMDLEIITLSEISQRQIYYITCCITHYITCGILNKKKGPK